MPSSNDEELKRKIQILRDQITAHHAQNPIQPQPAANNDAAGLGAYQNFTPPWRGRGGGRGFRGSYNGGRYHPYTGGGQGYGHHTGARNRTATFNQATPAPQQSGANDNASMAIPHSLPQSDMKQQSIPGKYTESLLPENASVVAQNTQENDATSYTITIDKISFSVATTGKKLVPVLNTSVSIDDVPTELTLHGQKFTKGPDGILYRSDALMPKWPAKVEGLCPQFTSTGTCHRGPSCRFKHDHDKVAICKDFLKGTCGLNSACDLSHQPSPNRSPNCLHFLRGNCTNGNNCRYTHLRVNPEAPVCPPFAILGYCEKGAECEDRHVFECPEYSTSGFCPRSSKCRLPHIDHAGRLRKKAEGVHGSSSPEASTGNSPMPEMDGSGLQFTQQPDYVPL